MFERNFHAPVFEDRDGTPVQVGMMPIGQGAATPLPILRDPAAEQAAREAYGLEVLRSTNPQMFEAMRKREKAQTEVAARARVASDLQHALTQAQRPQSPDSPLGLQEERRQGRTQLREQLDDALQELQAAHEELQAAQDVYNTFLVTT